jgi:hypothetical protein
MTSDLWSNWVIFGCAAGGWSRAETRRRLAGSFAGVRMTLPCGRPDASAHCLDAARGGPGLVSVRPW